MIVRKTNCIYLFFQWNCTHTCSNPKLLNYSIINLGIGEEIFSARKRVIYLFRNRNNRSLFRISDGGGRGN